MGHHSGYNLTWEETLVVSVGKGAQVFLRWQNCFNGFKSIGKASPGNTDVM
jgi:hypothetical protein